MWWLDSADYTAVWFIFSALMVTRIMLVEVATSQTIAIKDVRTENGPAR